jgi:hypothetical protein
MTTCTLRHSSYNVPTKDLVCYGTIELSNHGIHDTIDTSLNRSRVVTSIRPRNARTPAKSGESNVCDIVRLQTKKLIMRLQESAITFVAKMCGGYGDTESRIQAVI